MPAEEESQPATPITAIKIKRPLAVLKVFSVIPSGLEPETYCLEGSCSIQLSYETPFVVQRYVFSLFGTIFFAYINHSFCVKQFLSFNQWGGFVIPSGLEPVFY
jgi:hypothetical protein